MVRAEIFIGPAVQFVHGTRIDITAWRNDETECFEGGYWWFDSDRLEAPFTGIAMSLATNLKQLDNKTPGPPWRQVYTGRKANAGEVLEGMIDNAMRAAEGDADV